MAIQETWTKAHLKVRKGPGGDTLWERDFQYNPKDFNINVGAKWVPKSGKGGLLSAEYNGPVPRSIQVEMFLDASDVEDGDISPIVGELMGFVNPTADSKSKDKPTAPHADFTWGKSILFEGYIDSLAVKYTLFRHNGNPIRGSVTLTLKEFAEPDQGTNPTSGSEPGSRSHTVLAGDTLASIAFDEYGSAAYWRKIADANAVIDDPMRLLPGTSLLVPPT